MSFVAAAIGIGGVAGAAASYFGSQNAAKAQTSAETAALGFQEQQAQKQQPFIDVGTGAVNKLGGLFGIGAGGQPTTAPIDYSQFYNSPDYQFPLQQGNLALQNYYNANGLSRSGAGITAAINYNQGYASQYFGNYYNRLLGLSQIGTNAAANNNQAAGTIGNTIGNIGASQASGIVGGANAISGGIQGTISNALLYNAIKGTANPSGYASLAPQAAPQNPQLS